MNYQKRGSRSEHVEYVLIYYAVISNDKMTYTDLSNLTGKQIMYNYVKKKRNIFRMKYI